MLSRTFRFLKINVFFVTFFLFFLLLTTFIFRSLLLNISTHLLDWYDYPLYVWTMFQNIQHIKNGSFDGFFDGNIFYPFKGVLLFTDLFLPTSLIGFILSFFTKNIILIFNIVFFITIFLNITAVFMFWKNYFSSKWLLFFTTLTTAFSPFFFLETGHYQMLNFWPMFFGMAFLTRKQFSLKNAVVVGIFIGIQFLVSVYFSIFMLFALGIWYLIEVWPVRRKKQNLLKVFRHAVFVLLAFFAVAGFFIFKYIQVKNAYEIIRPLWEYVIYAANLTDYFFANYNSLVTNTSFVQKWNSFNQHFSSAQFPGLVLLTLSIIGMFIYQRVKKNSLFSFSLSPQNIFFITLMILGFIFSFGPRLSVNGTYIGIPLPYAIVLKLVPFFEPIRADVRWSFFFYFGLVYFATLGLQKLASFRKEATLVIFFSVLYLFEIVPISKLTEVKAYYPSVYKFIEDECREKRQVVLEYPLTQDKKGGNIVTNLTYRTQMIMASMHHDCDIINGYSGYIPKDYERFENEFYTTVNIGDEEMFWQLLKQRNVNIVKFNKNEIYENKKILIEKWLGSSTKSKILFNDSTFLIAKLLYSE